jgi:glycosyltransferase involved in cell wall biosynthesis
MPETSDLSRVSPQERPLRPAPTLVSVVVPTYNAEATLGQQLAALAQQDYEEPFEVLVVDNMSTDGSARIADSFAGQLKLSVIPATSNQSCSHACNVGIEHASGEFILFCAADDVVERSWISRMVAGARSFDLLGGNTVGTPDKLESLDRDRRLDLRSARPLRTPSWYDYDVVFGCNLGIWRDAVEQIGLYDESIRWAEDADLTLRALHAGLAVGFCDATIFNRPRSGFKATFRQRYQYGLSAATLFAKHQSHGMIHRPHGTVINLWIYWLLQTPRAFWHEPTKYRWARHIGWRTGCLVGSYRTRVWYP